MGPEGEFQQALRVWGKKRKWGTALDYTQSSLYRMNPATQLEKWAFFWKLNHEMLILLPLNEQEQQDQLLWSQMVAGVLGVAAPVTLTHLTQGVLEI